MGSSGGGGSSGAVTHSPYLEACHAGWLDHNNVDFIHLSATEVMNNAFGNSPWTAKNAYDPDAQLANYMADLADLKVILAGLSDKTDWADFYAQAELTLTGVGEVALIADVNAYAAILDDTIIAETLPRFRRGMQDINAVQSSAFVIGEAIIESFKNRDVAKYLSTIRMGLGDKKLEAVNQMMQIMARRIGWRGEFVKTSVEANRIKIVAKKEQTEQDATYDEHDAKWDLEVLQFGANVMAASAGGTSTSPLKSPTKAQSAIGGAMMGGAAGYMVGAEIGSVGGPYGAAIGAVLGAAVSMLGN
jgi:hypothetical protein